MALFIVISAKGVFPEDMSSAVASSSCLGGIPLEDSALVSIGPLVFCIPSRSSFRSKASAEASLSRARRRAYHSTADRDGAGRIRFGGPLVSTANGVLGPAATAIFAGPGIQSCGDRPRTIAVMKTYCSLEARGLIGAAR